MLMGLKREGQNMSTEVTEVTYRAKPHHSDHCGKADRYMRGCALVKAEQQQKWKWCENLKQKLNLAF